MGIEPTFEAWEAPVLPLNYTRSSWQCTEEFAQLSPANIPDWRNEPDKVQ